MKKLLSILLLLAGAVIALGGIGHSFGGVGQVHEALANQSLQPNVFRLILAVWHFAGASMVVFGLLVLWQWRELHYGRNPQGLVLFGIGLFYLLYGVWAVLLTNSTFFSIFVVLGVSVLICAYFLCKSA